MTRPQAHNSCAVRNTILPLPCTAEAAISTGRLELDRSRAYHRPTLMSVPSDGAGRSAADTTARLLARVQAGDGDAANDLFTRHMADLSRWARGRLPAWARDLTDTRDLVQDAVLETFRHVRGFEWRGKGAL